MLPLSTLGSQTRDGIKKKKKKTTQNSTPAKNTIKIKRPSVYLDIYIHQSMTEKRKKKCVQFRFPRSHCNALFFFFLSSESLFTQPIKTGFTFPLAPQYVGKKKKQHRFTLAIQYTYTRTNTHVHTHALSPSTRVGHLFGVQRVALTDGANKLGRQGQLPHLLIAIRHLYHHIHVHVRRQLRHDLCVVRAG